MRWNLSSNIRCKIRFFNVFLAPFTQKRFGHGTACVWNGATFFRDGTARLHFSFCRACLKIGTGPSTGAILTAHTDFFPRHGTVERFHGWHVFTAERLHGWAFTRLSVYTAGTARLIGVPRPTYLVVLGSTCFYELYGNPENRSRSPS